LARDSFASDKMSLSRLDLARSSMIRTAMIRTARTAVTLLFLAGLPSFGQAAPAGTDHGQQSPMPVVTSQSGPPFQLHAESNLVVVRVVVRDSQGRPLSNLRKENFTLLDNGEEQKISQFSVEIPAETQPGTPPHGGSPQAELPHQEAAGQPRQIAFYFDDLNMALDEINNARDAADSYLTKSLQPPDRAAIFTSSGKVHTDFTSDLKTLHEALTQVVPISKVRACPEISDYQAERIVDHEDGDAIGLAVSDLKNRCHACPPAGNSSLGKPGDPLPDCPPAEVLIAYVRHDAEVALDEARQRSQRSIAMLDAIVLGMAHMYGQKEIILTSPGFIPWNLGEELNHVIDHALNSQIVISSLDPKGLPLLMPGSDVSTTIDPQSISFMNSFASSSEHYTSAVLWQIAEETGGDFFHNNNDLNAGFARLAEEPVSYILAFTPSNLDGKFHKLQVRLVEAKGTLQARRGYFAVKQASDIPTVEAQEQEELRQTVASRQEFHDLALNISTQLDPANDGGKQLTVLLKLDLNSVSFRKDGDRNLNTLTFIAGIYDAAGKWITGEQKRVDLKLPDAQLADMRAKGVGMKNVFELKPGSYLVREVVMESENHHVGAVNLNVQVN
jgi:VWFA-related protein